MSDELKSYAESIVNSVTKTKSTYGDTYEKDLDRCFWALMEPYELAAAYLAGEANIEAFCTSGNLRKLAEHFDDPNKMPNLGINTHRPVVTPGFILRSIADALDGIDAITGGEE